MALSLRPFLRLHVVWVGRKSFAGKPPGMVTEQMHLKGDPPVYGHTRNALPVLSCRVQFTLKYPVDVSEINKRFTNDRQISEVHKALDRTRACESDVVGTKLGDPSDTTNVYDIRAPLVEFTPVCDDHYGVTGCLKRFRA